MPPEKEKKLSALIKQIISDHEAVPASATAESDIAIFEIQAEFALPDDMKYFYRHIESANLFGETFVIKPLSEIQLAYDALGGEEDLCPENWFAFCNRGANGDWVGIDLSNPFGHWPILDLDHETEPFDVIALSLSEFLRDALKWGKDSVYWLENKESSKRYGSATYFPGTEGAIGDSPEEEPRITYDVEEDWPDSP